MVRLLSITLFAFAAIALSAGLVIPTGAVTVDQPADQVGLNAQDPADGDLASTSGDDEFELHFDRLNDRAETMFDEVFVITAGEAGPFWIEEDIEGVTFYVDDPENEIDSSNRVRLAANESVTVGVQIDAHVVETGTESFTVATETPEIENRELPASETAILGVPLGVGLVTMLTAANRRRKL